MLGGVRVTVDDTAIDPAKCYFYKGGMLSGVPNCFIGMGYTNASWTLKVRLTTAPLFRDGQIFV